MGYNFEQFLANAFYSLVNELHVVDVNIIISEEQDFVKLEKEPNKLYIVYKEIGGPNSDYYRTIPVQIFVMSEENSLEQAKNLLKEFSTRYNFYQEQFTYTKDGSPVNGLVKHSYLNPVVLSNYNQVQLGYRSILYVSGSLTIMDEMLPLWTLDQDEETVYNAIKIESEVIKILHFAISYSMTPDTQPIQENNISRSEKSVSTLSLSISIPMVNYNFVYNCLYCASEVNNGNESYKVEFNYGGVDFDLNMKLISFQTSDSPDEPATIQIGLML